MHMISSLSLACRDIEAEGVGGSWTCDQMPGGGTCRSSAGEWGAAVRRKAQQARLQATKTSLPMQVLSDIMSVCHFLDSLADMWRVGSSQSTCLILLQLQSTVAESILKGLLLSVCPILLIPQPLLVLIGMQPHEQGLSTLLLLVLNHQDICT